MAEPAQRQQLGETFAAAYLIRMKFQLASNYPARMRKG